MPTQEDAATETTQKEESSPPVLEGMAPRPEAAAPSHALESDPWEVLSAHSDEVLEDGVEQQSRSVEDEEGLRRRAHAEASKQ